jgi:hypothetical protein
MCERDRSIRHNRRKSEKRHLELGVFHVSPKMQSHATVLLLKSAYRGFYMQWNLQGNHFSQRSVVHRQSDVLKYNEFHMDAHIYFQPTQCV